MKKVFSLILIGLLMVSFTGSAKSIIEPPTKQKSEVVKSFKSVQDVDLEFAVEAVKCLVVKKCSYVSTERRKLLSHSDYSQPQGITLWDINGHYYWINWYTDSNGNIYTTSQEADFHGNFPPRD